MKKSNSNPFAKFGTRKSNAAIKEQFRQEKRKVKKIIMLKQAYTVEVILPPMEHALEIIFTLKIFV